MSGKRDMLRYAGIKRGKFKWDGYIGELTDLPSLTSQWEKDLTRQIIDNIPKSKVSRVLEVGCSNGRWLRWFCKEYNCEGEGLDNNPMGFKRKDLNFVIGDAFKLPYKDGAFDVLFSLGLIEHFKTPKNFLILKEQVRVLKIDGFLICQIPNLRISLEHLWIKYFYDYKQGYKHFKITGRELLSYFKQLNLEIIVDKFSGWFFERFNISKLFDAKFTSTEYLLIGRKK